MFREGCNFAVVVMVMGWPCVQEQDTHSSQAQSGEISSPPPSTAASRPLCAQCWREEDTDREREKERKKERESERVGGREWEVETKGEREIEIS